VISEVTEMMACTIIVDVTIAVLHGGCTLLHECTYWESFALSVHDSLSIIY